MQSCDAARAVLEVWLVQSSLAVRPLTCLLTAPPVVRNIFRGSALEDPLAGHISACRGKDALQRLGRVRRRNMQALRFGSAVWGEGMYPQVPSQGEHIPAVELRGWVSDDDDG